MTRKAGDAAPRDRVRNQKAPERVAPSAALLSMQKAVEATQVGVTVTDPDGLIIFTNAAEAAMHGYSREELLGTEARLLAPPELREPLSTAELLRVRAWTRETVNLHKDGSRFPVRLTSDVVTDEDGKPTGIVTTCQDITEAKRTEQALRDSGERYRSLVNHLGEVVFQNDASGRWLFLNPAWTEITGFAVGDSIGKALIDSVHPDDRDRTLDLFQRCVEGSQESGRAEIRVLTAGGGTRWVALSAGPTRADDGRVVGVSGTLADISQRRDAQDELATYREHLEDLVKLRTGELEDANQQLRSEVAERCRAEESLSGALAMKEAIFAGSRDAIFISDAESRFVAVNRAACELTGYSSEELRLMRIPDLHEDVDLQAYRAYHDRILAGEEVLSEALILRKDGSKVAAEFNNRRLVIEGKVLIHTTARDITERTHADEALQESEEKFRFLAEANPSAIFIVQDDKFVYANRASEDLTGYSLDEIKDWDFWDLVVPRYRALVKRRGLARQAGEDVPVRYEFAILTKVGQEKWVDYTARALTYRGRPALIGTVLDATARKHADEALRESEARYRDLVENSTDLICTHDLDGTLLSVNHAVLRMIDYPAEEVVGRNLRDLLAPDRRPQFGLYLDTLRRDGAAAGIMKIVTRSGAVRYWEYSNTLRTKGVPAPVVRGLARDVTDRVLAERALKESEQRYRELFEAHPIPMWVYNLDSLRVLAVNQAAVDSYGYSRDEFLAMTIRDLRPEEDFVRFDADIAEVRRSAAGFNGPSLWRHRRKDGAVFDVEITAHAIPMAGRPARVITAQDVSERQALEEQLRQSQKMEAIGLLAGGVAHDFNNLLQTMLSLAALGRGEAGISPQAAARFRELEDQIRRGASLTRQLLLFSRRETVRPERLDLNDVVRGAGGMLRRLVRGNIALDLRLADGVAPVEADRGQLDQVVVNLVVNASDAMPGGGQLEVSTEIGLDTVILSVADTGHGIPAAIRDKIFDPFFTTKGANQGTGLGLSVVHGIVTRYGGTIAVDSREGKGTTFRITWPRCEQAGEAPLAAEAAWETARGRGERILIVEDEDSARDALQEILTSEGYRVSASASGEAALVLSEAELFDLLLTDLMLPGIGGGEVALELGQRWPDLKVIYMSGYTEDEAVRLASGGGFVRYLQKPFTIARLAREVRSALDS